jgi:ABC-type multidrug transport system ATPase subunit
MKSILSIQQLEKSYQSVKALKGVSFEVKAGSVFGILGPNGSGKTTMLGILLDVLKADSGAYTWHGFAHHNEARKHIGSLLETPNFYHYMSAEDNLKITAKIKGRGENDIDDVLRKVNLYDRKGFPFQTFSLGMKQRLAIAAALLGKPTILVFDEPTNGLDPVGITEIRELILKLNQEGTTIIMASHLLDEVEKVCTDVAILKLGNLVASGSVADVLSDDDWIEIAADDMVALSNIIKEMPNFKQAKQEKQLLVAFHQVVSSESINQFCFQQGITLNHLQKRKRSLESKFMELTA